MPTPIVWPLVQPQPSPAPPTPFGQASGPPLPGEPGLPQVTRTLADRSESESHLIVNGRPVTIKLISNPLIDDVVITEAKMTASEIENGPLDTGRRVDRGIRDFLIRLGVEH